MPELVALPPDYYLTNFCALMDFVWKRYEPLLSSEERQLYRAFEQVGENSQQLYVRLLSRKGVPSSRGALFRLGKLRYDEIVDLPAAAECLVGAGLLAINPALSLEECLPLFTKAELISRTGLMSLKAAKRDVLEQRLLTEENAETIAQQIQVKEVIYQVLAAEHFETFKLCFFGNLRQDLTDYVLRDLGLYRYEDYPLDQHNLPFRSREQIDQHRCFYACMDRMEETLAGDVEDILHLYRQFPMGIADDATLNRRLGRSKLTLARQLERLDALDDAETLYRNCSQPPARERRARIAAKRGEIAAGLALCREILTAPVNEEEKVFAESFGYRTAQKYQQKEPLGLEWPQPVIYKPHTETLTLCQKAESVELVVAAHLAQRGHCFYVENSLFCSVLGLFIWEIVFSAVPGAFFNPFQAAPSDFYTPDFYRLRRASIEQQLEQVSGDAFIETVWRTYRDKQGVANPLVHWDVLSEELLSYSLERISRSHWQSLFSRLLTDLRHHRNGLPDLILFPDDGGYELVEVKGPGDRLQKNQRRWMSFFAEQNIPHRVVHVIWA